DERQLQGWCSGETGAVPAGQTLDGRLSRQAAERPDSVAVCSTDGITLTHAEFDARVNRLARLLLQGGLRAGARVAVLLPRSPELVVALAGVLRAGGTAVPLETAYPDERVRYILQDSGAWALLTDRSTEARSQAPQAQTGLRVVHLDDEAATGLSGLRGDEVGSTERSRVPLPGDSALRVYTSGTTGRPKAVELSHRALSHRLHWGQSLLGLDREAVTLWKSAVGFIDSATELFGGLTAGATVVVADDETARDPQALVEAIRRSGVTHLLTVPSLADPLLEAAARTDPAGLPSLRLWLSSGEALSPRLAAAMQSAAPRATVRNFYGSTEVTGDATQLRVVPGEAASIGTPVMGTTARVLDPWLRQVPAGVLGELYLGGAQLADGYGGQTRLTAERFVADPASTSGDRLYRTGDLVRWDQEGRLEYLGRADDQVKIRGSRVELDEVRAVLEEHPGVAAAAITVCDHPAGGQYLAGYLTRASGVDRPEQIREWLRGRLPDHMVPAVLTELAQLPVTANGKLDRGALPEPDLGLQGVSGRGPESESEKLVAELFREVLALSESTELSVDDDFFRLGGDSILASRVINRAAGHGLHVTLRGLFEQRTVRNLAAAAAAPVAEGEPVVEPAAEPAAAPSSPVLEALRDSGQDINSWLWTERLDLTRAPGAAEVQRGLTQLADSHEALRLRVTPKRRLWLNEILPQAATMVVEEADSLEPARLAARDSVDLSAGRPVGAALVRGSVSVVLAAHAGALDRGSAHRLALALRELLEQGTVQALPARTGVQHALAALKDRRPPERASRNGSSPEGVPEEVLAEMFDPDHTETWDMAGGGSAGPGPDGLATPDALQRVLCKEVSELVPQVVLEADLPLHSEDGAFGPFTVAVPQDPAGIPARTGQSPQPAPGEDNRAEAPAGRSRRDRRSSRRGASEPAGPRILVTREYGATSAPAPEGYEGQYSAVIRYRYQAPQDVHVAVRGLTAAQAKSLRERLGMRR
ncbi:MAG: amino acid adenylation domain-containing protein, partial [Citricoccus sp.]